MFGTVTTAKTSSCSYLFWKTVWARHCSDYSRACLYIKWAWFALSDRCALLCSCKTICWACVQKMHLFIGMKISAETGMQGTTKWFKGEASFSSWDSCFGPVIVLPLFMLIVLQSVLVALQLCSGYCVYVLKDLL